MTPERWEQIEEAFHRAAESDPQQRPLVLEEACGSDTKLREEVEALLSADQEARSKMQSAVRSELAAAAFSLVGKTVSHYRMLGGIGTGGMGVVYRAQDLKLGRCVAIKLLPPELARDPEALARFEREARSASILEHPNICPVYEFGEYEGQPFLVMQLLEGQTLRDLIDRGNPANVPFDSAKFTSIATGIANGLIAAHSQGIIHRDIKPANLFVTTFGEVKILDFGLAKLQHVNSDRTQSETAHRSAPAPYLSQTGTNFGTVGYMSPEQTRGETLDTRSDLFSFGLVMYELATGQKGIQGRDNFDLGDATLMQTPTPPRDMHPGIPHKLEAIIRRCIERDLQRRYQSASEIRSDLLRLAKPTKFSRLRPWLVVASVTVLAFSGLWVAKRHRSPSTRSELRLRQLTANSSENNVSGGLISPDGRYLAYSDYRGLHVKVIETGQIRTVPRPKELAVSFAWKCGAWSPNSDLFLANSSPPLTYPGEISDTDVTIWLVPLSTLTPRKLRGHAFAWSFSPDGSLIAFGTNGGPHGPREIWLMDPNGEHAHKQLESGNNDTINTAVWSADGKRLIYARDRGEEVTLFSQDLNGGPPVLLERGTEIKDRRIDFGITLPNGRTIFSVTEQEGTAATSTCNFWETRNDLRTGKLLAPPRQLTQWAGFCMDPTSVTADGKKLAFVQMAGHPSIAAADLSPDGTRISKERHVTLSESADIVAGWSRDSEFILFFSNRNGRAGIYRQSLESDAAEPLLTTQQGLSACCVTPNGESLVYATTSKQSANVSDLMRLSLSDGTSQRLFSVTNVEAWGCGGLASNLCVIAERSDDRKYAVVTRFEPETGRGAEMTRIALDPNTTNWTLALAPEGRRLAVIRKPGGPLQTLSTNGLLLKETKLEGWANSAPIYWSLDGHALYVPVTTPAGAQLLHVDLRGNAKVLRNNPGGDYTFGIPSPDHRHLAIESTADNRNIWVMENF